MGTCAGPDIGPPEAGTPDQAQSYLVWTEFPRKLARHGLRRVKLEQSDGWAVQRWRTMTLESIAPIGDDPLVSLPNLAV